jgi:hypothetical protein
MTRDGKPNNRRPHVVIAFGRDAITDDLLERSQSALDEAGIGSEESKHNLASVMRHLKMMRANRLLREQQATEA